MDDKLTSRPDLDRGWSWVVMVASFASLYIIGGINFSVGLIHATLLERYHEGQSMTSWVGALHTAVMNLAAPLSSFIINRYSVRTAVVTGGVLLSAGYMATAFAPTLGLTVFTCGIVSGLGGAIGWTASMIAPGFYFQRYRNLAIGFAMTGNAVGLFGTAPAIQTAKEVYGPTGFFIVLACISVHQIVCGTLMKPSSLEMHTQRRHSRDQRTSENSNNFCSVLTGYFKVCSNLQVIIISLSFLLVCFGNYSIFLHLPNLCMHSGNTPMQASYVLSALGVSSILGRLVTGFAANLENVNEMYLHIGSIFGIGVAALLFPVYGDAYAGQMVFAIIVGFFFGTPFVTATPINIKLVGLHNMAAALGNELFMGGIGAIIGPVLTSFLLDEGLTYPQLFMVAGGMDILAASLGFVSLVLSRNSKSTIGDLPGMKEEVVEMVEPEKEKMIANLDTENG